MNPFTLILAAIAKTITFWHEMFGRLFGDSSGFAWALAIVFLTVTLRLIMFPLFVKQIRSQRAMQELQPKMKALQAKHKGDRETLNQELMKLYKEQGVNPLAGCLPLLLQAPVFIALFQVLKNLQPKLVDGTLEFQSRYGVPESTVEQLGRSKIWGAPIVAGWSSPSELIQALGASVTATKIVAVLLIVAMTALTFFTTRQMMARNATTPLDPQQQMQQRILLYVMPIMLAIFGFGVAIGVLIYWTTSNLWSMGQQYYVLKRMPLPAGAPATAAPASRPNRSGTAAASATGSTAPSAKPATATAGANASGGSGGSGGTAPARVPSAKSRKRAKQRRGGRR